MDFFDLGNLACPPCPFHVSVPPPLADEITLLFEVDFFDLGNLACPPCPFHVSVPSPHADEITHFLLEGYILIWKIWPARPVPSAPRDPNSERVGRRSALPSQVRTASLQKLDVGPPASTRTRGWRKTVGNLIEMFWLNKNLSRASIYWYVREQKKGAGFVKFEISSSTTSTAFGQPLKEPARRRAARSHFRKGG